MKTVLLYANEDKGLESRLQAALDCARAFDAHLACVQVTPFDSFIMGDPFGGVYAVPTVLEQVRETETRHRERIEARLKTEGVSWDWLRYDGSPAQILVDRSRLADLVVLSLPAEGPGRDAALSIAGDVVLHAKPPVLAVPPESRGLDPRAAVLVAWDGSVEACHALRQSLAMLGKAERVHVVTVSDDPAQFPATDAAVYLSRHGIDAELHEWPRDGRSTAAALIDAAAVLKAAYLVMGAYGHSRLREAVLGGATRGMLRSSPLPLLLSH